MENGFAASLGPKGCIAPGTSSNEYNTGLRNIRLSRFRLSTSHAAPPMPRSGTYPFYGKR